MGVYRYIAITKEGERITGEREADSKDTVLRFLQDKNFTVVSLNEKVGVQLDKLLSGDVGGMPLKDKLVLVRQLSTMISAGIPIIQAIDILVQQEEKPAMKAKLLNIYKSIESGSSLSEAFRRQPGIFSEIHMSLLQAGEKSANLNEMLLKIADDLEKSNSIRGKIIGAMIYPAIIFIALIGVFVLMITTMIPQVKELYESLGQHQLPAVTQILVDIGNLFTNPFFLVVLVIVIISIIATYRYADTTEKGKRFIDRMKLKIPIFGGIIKKAEIVQFTRLLSMLMKSGIQIIDAITIVRNSSGNKIYKDILTKSIDEVTKGNGLAVSIAKYNEYDAFPIILVRIMSTGEESGKLDQILQDMSVFYQAELDQVTSNLTKIMEPLIMVLAGGMVAFLAIAVYLPIFQVGQYVQ